MNRLTEGVKNLLIIHVIFLFAYQVLKNYNVDLGLHLPMSGNPSFQPFQLVTSVFVAPDFRALLFSGIALYFVGGFVETMLGFKNFFSYYLICAFAGMGLNILLYTFFGNGGNDYFYGPDGAINGVIIFFLVYFWNKELNLLFIPIQFKGWMLFILFFTGKLWAASKGFQGVSPVWSAIGGSIAGFLYLTYWRRKS